MTEPTIEPARAVEEKTGRELSDETIINPEREVKLSNGERVVVAPWGMKEGHLILERLEALQPALVAQGGKWNAHELLSTAWNEMVDLVAMTVGVERAEMEKPPSEKGWTFEDMLEATEAVLDVCFVRSDGRGALPLLVALVGKMGEIAMRAASGRRPATPLASDSAPADISKAN